MTLLPLVIAAIGGGLLSVAMRDARRASAGIGLLGLVIVAALAALLADPAATSPLGGEAVALDGFARLFLATAAVTGLLLSALWLALPVQRAGGASLPDETRVFETGPAAAFLLFVAGAALALGIVSPLTALLPSTLGGMAAFVAVGRLATDIRPRGGRGGSDVDEAEARLQSRRLGLDLLRAAVALALVVTALELLVGLADAVAGEPFGVGAALLAVAGAVALRVGAVPVHAHAIRLAEHANRAAVPVLVLWGPALFALVALAGHEAAILPLGLPLSIERGVIGGLAVLTIVAGALGSLVQDDVDHVVAYSAVGDGGFVLLAFASSDPAVWGPARAWLLVLPLVKSALLAWTLGVGRTYGTRSLLELRGWARRAPLLAVALMLVTVATVGLPGFMSWDARLALIRGAFSEPIRTAVLALSLIAVIAVVRVLWVGFDRPTTLVEGAPSERMRRPAPDLRRRVGNTTREILDLNRAPASAVIVLVLAILALAVSLGVFNARNAASADLPAPLPGAEPTAPPEPTFQPIPTEVPSPSAGRSGGAATARPSASVTVAPASPRPTR
jgi:formate hydrogenlyase subunit 3/multisubunit Na+/H+ antiporter MnhD subunit